MPEQKSDARDQVGKAFNVSGKTVDHATRVLKNAAPEVIKARGRGLRDRLDAMLDWPRVSTMDRYHCRKEAKPAEVTPDDLRPPPPIAAPVDPRTWSAPAAIVERMGKEADAALGRECGVSAQVIADHRRRLNIPMDTSDKDARRWTAAMDKDLGAKSDDELAASWGMSREAVRRRRPKLGIGATRKMTAWTPERLAVLAETADDDQAAAKLGISTTAVKVARSRQKKKITPPQT